MKKVDIVFVICAVTFSLVLISVFFTNITTVDIHQSNGPSSPEQTAIMQRLAFIEKSIAEGEEQLRVISQKMDFDPKEIIPLIETSSPNIRGAPLNQNDRNPTQNNLPKKTYNQNNEFNSDNKHQILSLDDNQFRQKPLDEMMETYGPTLGGGSCENDFGMGLVNRWRALKKEYCQPQSKTDTSINCYFIQQTRHHGAGDQLCTIENGQFNFRQLNNPSITGAVMKKYVDSHHVDEAYVHFSSGLISGTCTTSPSIWKPDHFPGWNKDITFDGFKKTLSLECDQWIEHPVLIVQRHTFANFYHDSEDFLNAFLAMSILQWNSADTQILITDLYPEGPFWSIWSKAFSWNHPAMTAWDIKEKFGNQNICFRKAAVSIYGPAAPTTIMSWDTPCKHTHLVRAYADFIIRGFNLQHKTHYARESPPDYITVTWVARRSSVIWPEKRFCSDNSFFKCDLWDHLSVRKLGRVVKNDNQIVARLKELESYKLPGDTKIVFRDVDYNLLTLEEQIEIDITTDIMVGPHGAGLTHNIFMPDRAHLIELWIDGSSANRHFHNLAFWQGRNYQGVSINNPLDPDKVFRLIVSAAEKIDVTEY